MAGGYDVGLSGSGPAERIALIVDVLAPGARALSTHEVFLYADLIVLAVPMHRFRELPHDLFAGKILVDAMNYWEEIDGVNEEFATAPAGTSVLVQDWFPSARVVKSLNHLGYFKFEKSRRPRGTAGRLALAVAGDDRAAVAAVLQLVDRLGFDAVDAGASRPVWLCSRVAQCSELDTTPRSCRSSFRPRQRAPDGDHHC